MVSIGTGDKWDRRCCRIQGERVVQCGIIRTNTKAKLLRYDLEE